MMLHDKKGAVRRVARKVIPGAKMVPMHYIHYELVPFSVRSKVEHPKVIGL